MEVHILYGRPDEVDGGTTIAAFTDPAKADRLAIAARAWVRRNPFPQFKMVEDQTKTDAAFAKFEKEREDWERRHPLAPYVDKTSGLFYYRLFGTYPIRVIQD